MPSESARKRLHYVRPYETPGFTRRSAGDRVEFRDARGRRAAPRDRARFEALAVPPAWTEVWLAPSASAHILAVGLDEAGRRQYLYHPQWRSERDALKFDRALQLAEVLATARRRAARDAGSPALSRERVLWTAFRLLDRTGIRVGGEEYAAASGARGLCTLLRRHARVEGSSVMLSFVAKGGKLATLTIDDAQLAAALDELVTGRAPGSRLLAWRDGRRRRPVHASEVNDYLRGITGLDVTAKDLRTLRGTLAAAVALPRRTPETTRDLQRAIRTATEAAAAALGNTPAIARASYIHPGVFEAFADGRTIAPGGGERALLRLLGDGS